MGAAEDTMLLAEHPISMDVKETGYTSGSSLGQSRSTDPSHPPPSYDPDLNVDHYHGGILSGWRAGLYYAAFLVFLVLATNSGFTIWVALHRGFPQNESGTIYTGDCNHVKRSNIGLHLLTNLLSTVLLAASNYTMQFLSAPTRKAVDKAHSQGCSLRIGVPSLSNLRWNGRRKMILWGLLAVSAVPLHLFFNSVFYVVVSANNYQVFSVADYFLDPTSQTQLGNNGFQPADVSFIANGTNASDQLKTIRNLQHMAQAGQLQRLNNYDCVNAYKQDYVTDRTHVLLVATHNSTSALDAQLGRQGLVYKSETMNNAVLFGRGCKIDPFPWMCPPAPADEECPLPCKYRLEPVFANINYWEAEGVQVDHCLSMETPAQCELMFNRPATAVVIATNIVKIAVILTVAFGPLKSPLANIGDAIASFLWLPDPTTSRRALATSKSFKPAVGGGFERIPARQFSYHRPRWFQAASTKRWVAFMFLFAVCLFLCFFILGYGIPRIVGKHDSTSLMNLGLGGIHFETLISSITPSSGLKGLLSNILVANAPQLVLSLLYFAINNLLTSMLAEREWSQFAYYRKGLRVSDKARGAQRSTHFLSLPYRYALPLLGISTLLHWLVSQSLFLVVLKTYCDQWTYCPSMSYNGYTDVNGVAIGMCWSPLGVVLSIVVGSLMAAYVILLGFRRYRPGLPLAAGSSAVISAACHPSEAESHDPRMAAGYLKWGVVESTGDRDSLRKRETQTSAYGEKEIWHCAFTTGSVEIPHGGLLCA